LEGNSSKDEWWLVHIDWQGAHYHRADDLLGLGVYAAAPLLLERLSPDVAIALIGTAGEMGLKAAGTQNLGANGTPSWMAARGGFGAVMGSKGVKAIVINAHDAEGPPAADVERLRKVRRRYHQALLNHP
jgi:aldehyde:ferredoxin oxidoreductase